MTNFGMTNESPGAEGFVVPTSADCGRRGARERARLGELCSPGQASRLSPPKQSEDRSVADFGSRGRGGASWVEFGFAGE